jgi:protein-tyrosine phosphatase
MFPGVLATNGTGRQRKTVRGFVDLHCHWIAAIDDGAPTREEGLGIFDNQKSDLEEAFRAFATASETGLPKVGLSSEHFFDDIVFQRLMKGDALPYPGGKAVLVEFPNDAFPARVAARFFDLRMRKLRPVLAHPERYRPVWKDRTVLDPFLDGGVVLLLDVAALAGKYGRAPERAALELLEDGYYVAACSDAHRTEDVEDVARGIERLEKLVGREEAEYLLRDGPLAILNGTIET